MPGSDEKLFDVAAEGYDRLMGRYLPTLGPAFADAAGVTAGLRALDVGCGPGGLTSVLVERLGPDAVAALDPSAPFVAACRDRHPGVEVRQGVAEDMPYADGSFDVSLACLVVGFMTDPVAGAAEMRRVTRPGGTVALCFWELERMPLIGTFWRAVRAIRPDEQGEALRFGRQPGQLKGLLEQVGARGVAESSISGTSTYADFEDWWSSFTGGAGPVGAYQASLSSSEREEVRVRAHELLGAPSAEFSQEAWAWCAVGRV